MRRALALFLMLLGFGGFAAVQSLPAVDANSPHFAVLYIDGPIEPVSARYLSRSVDAATKDGAQFVVLVLDTPGGLFDSTKDMVEKILASDIPVIVFVSPPGAQAASAGTLITAAGHVAAMAPTTNIGAASPVGSSGEDLPETLKSKATQHVASYLRGIAEERGRNSEALEQTVLTAASYSASEALQNNIIDLIAEDMDDLLAQLDGWSVELRDGEVVIETEDLQRRDITQTPVERFLGVLANPNIAFVLLTLGMLGIFVEYFTPGLIGPGVVGVIALALAFVALGNLPVNWVGVGLIGVAAVAFFFELQAPGIGIFGIAGAVGFVLGAFLLFGGFTPPPIPTPSFGVSLWLIAVISGILFGFLLLFLRTALQARRALYTSSAKMLVGQTATVTKALEPKGTVRGAGEMWSAVSDTGESIPEGEEVIVLDIEGLTLKVVKASEAEQ